ncbi:permease [Candidatus Bipolaricaulota bacterium]|nr:permease [Candidatus Bipolaricaulota bacterium]TFH09621.1 MAG: hypothetical protein E4H08_05365 [Candidatus Atribacteria bacterium]
MFLAIEQIGRMVLQDLGRVWPLLLISIPFAVALRVTGASKRLTGAFGKRPIVGILMATAIATFSPLCSCTVIPVIAAMLIGGVPLAPVMAFWIASPTMDPEIFFMSVAFLGWPLAIGRLVATVLLSLAAGFITHWIVKRGWIGNDFVKAGAERSTRSVSSWVRLKAFLVSLQRRPDSATSAVAGCGCSVEPAAAEVPCGCSSMPAADATLPSPGGLARWIKSERLRAVLKESIATTLWVGRFLLIAFVLEALIRLYVPQDVIVQWSGRANPWAPLLAALVGIPVYTGNLMAVPLIGGLLTQGMSEGAALSFLIAGPVTTIPAMAAVWGVVKPRVFALYFGIGLVGAIVFGYLYQAALVMLDVGG